MEAFNAVIQKENMDLDYKTNFRLNESTERLIGQDNDSLDSECKSIIENSAMKKK